MTKDTATRTITLGVITAIIAALVLWTATLANASKLDTGRFVADSVSRDAQAQADHALLQRIDTRVGQIYCSRVPVAVYAGCQ